MSGTFGDLLKKAGLEASAEAEAAPEAPEAAPETPEEVAYGPKLVIRFTKKGHRGKTVTLVQGVVSGHEALLARLKRELGSGGRLDGTDLVLQGNQVERVARWFESQGVSRVVRG